MRNLSIKVSAVPFFPYDPNSFLSIGSNPGSWSCYWAVTRWDLCCGLFWGTGLNFDGYWFGVGLAPLSGCKRTGLNWFIWGICTQALGCPMGRFLEQFLRVLNGKNRMDLVPGPGQNLGRFWNNSAGDLRCRDGIKVRVQQGRKIFCTASMGTDRGFKWV